MRALVDTNLLIYAYDRSEPRKRQICQALLRELALQNALVLSVQILNEFGSVALRKRDRIGLTPTEIGELIEEIASLGEVLPLTPRTARMALSVVERHQLHFWDALLWAVASINEVPRILSEDFQHGQILEGVEFFNPLLST